MIEIPSPSSVCKSLQTLTTVSGLFGSTLVDATRRFFAESCSIFNLLFENILSLFTEKVEGRRSKVTLSEDLAAQAEVSTGEITEDGMGE